MSARRAAAELTIAVLDNGRAFDEALDETKSFSALEGRDRAFARALASATLRHLGGIDAILAQFLTKPLPESAVAARAILRTGAAQLLVLRTPPHAAVGESVTLANAHRGTAGFAKLMNAVLRKVAQEGPALMAAQKPGADLPAWLFTRWRAAYGDETAAAIAAALHAEPPLDLTAKDDADALAAGVQGALLATGSIRLSSPPSGVEALEGFGDGAFWVQDAAAALPAKLLGDVRGKRVLDLCAAPGGKTLQLAAGGAHVTALDRADDRLTRLRESLARTKLDAEIVCADALAWTPAEPFDAVLLDAPCSSTGTLRRHPDVAWLRRPTDIAALADLQKRLLARAADFVTPGGALVYAVCSLEPEEGPSIIAGAGPAWRRDPITAEEIGDAGFVTSDGALRTLPSHWPDRGGLDGFYAARLKRV
ncbi:MAG: transcription antitermination factor NusB [Caulobacterales bacterium]